MIGKQVEEKGDSKRKNNDRERIKQREWRKRRVKREKAVCKRAHWEKL